MNNKTSRLFKGGSDWRLNACVGHNGGLLGFCSMGNGYYRSAELLSKHVVSTGFEMDLLIYPIVFSYRHGIELFLKGFLVKIRNANDDSTNDFLNHHLSAKWKEVKQFIKDNKFDSKDDDENIFLTDIIDDVIDDFSKYDPGSFHFRYHISKSGNVNQEDVKLINIKNLKIRMDKVFKIFKFWWGCLDDMDD
ncbi:hypothetical protein KAJ61_06105 [Candidatus Parcubacteria bacterium]|nr:hypothetical protein [Candidatus Parcubacteria bacterium]